MSLRRMKRPRPAAALVIVALFLVAAGGAEAQRRYLHDRYRGSSPDARLYNLATGLQHQRIGVIGYQYPFFGPHLDNVVSYVGTYLPNHYFAAPTNCVSWRRTLAAGRYNDVVIQPDGILPTSTATFVSWTRSLPGAREILDDSAGAMFALPQTISTFGC
jgi:hypothetical protein